MANKLSDFTQDFGEMLEGLKAREQKNLVRNALRVEARRIRKMYVGRFKQSNLRDKSKIGKVVTAGVSRSGLRLTVKLQSKKKPHVWLTRRGKLKPVQIWAETGTEERSTKHEHMVHSPKGKTYRRRGGASRGSMGSRKAGVAGFHIMEGLRLSETPKVAERVRQELAKKVPLYIEKKIKKKYGNRI